MFFWLEQELINHCYANQQQWLKKLEEQPQGTQIEFTIILETKTNKVINWTNQTVQPIKTNNTVVFDWVQNS